MSIEEQERRSLTRQINRQGFALLRNNAVQTNFATVTGRDTGSGYREVSPPSGGVEYARYLSTVQAQTVPPFYLLSNVIGQAAIINDRPAV
jgi:hypothetical protein